MLAYNNPRNTPLFASFEHLASSVSPRRVLCVVNRRKGMNLMMNLAGCGIRDERGGFIMRCSVRGGDWDLEGQILEFMKKSSKPAAFPSKKELIDAGRMDLVMGIEREGGWLALGWDLEDEVVGCGGDVVEDWEAIVARPCDSEAPECSRSETGRQNGSMMEEQNMVFGSESSPALSSSVQTQCVYRDEATGIEGILSRLGMERSTAFSVTKKEQGMLGYALSDNGVNNHGTLPFGSPLNTTVAEDDSGSNEGTNNFLATNSQDIDSPGVSNMEFEAADISFNMNSDVEADNVSRDTIFTSSSREGTGKTVHRRPDSSENHYSPEFIRTRLRNLESELSVTLQSLKSKRDESTTSKASNNLSEELQNVSDAWEFQQTEIMHAKDALRSIRAKLAVLEGKMTMAIIDAQKMVEVKQKKIDQARHALQLLRTVPIIWPNSASEVLLTGSFDGWTTQRKMEKSAAGIHSLSLMLYPGIYEIKFIVDGVWKIDPLRPITLNNVFENNLLTVY